MNQENTYNITAYNLFDFLKEVQNAVQQGYVLSDKNSHFPQAFVSLYTCTLVKESVKIDISKEEYESQFEDTPREAAEVATIVAEDNTPTKEVTIKDIVSNQEKKTAGRPAKAKK